MLIMPIITNLVSTKVQRKSLCFFFFSFSLVSLYVHLFWGYIWNGSTFFSTSPLRGCYARTNIIILQGVDEKWETKDTWRWATCTFGTTGVRTRWSGKTREVYRSLSVTSMNWHCPENPKTCEKLQILCPEHPLYITFSFPLNFVVKEWDSFAASSTNPPKVFNLLSPISFFIKS